MSKKPPYDSIHVLWDFMQLDQPPRSVDALVVLGSIDDRVAVHAAWLANQYTFRCVVMTGGHVERNSRQQVWKEPTEADHFAAVFRAHLHRPLTVLLETRAQHTGENATLSFEVLVSSGTQLPRTVLLVTKPYMERRALGTFEAQWPARGTRFFVSSAPRQLNAYCTDEYPLLETVGIMLKDFRKMQQYGEQGWQTRVVVPPEVEVAAVVIEKWLAEEGIE